MEGSGHIDATVLRDADDPEVFASAGHGLLENRKYYFQNWRADVVALIEASGDPFEHIRYSAYGGPFVYGAGDINRDGVVDGFDPQDWDDLNLHGTGAMKVPLDVNRDGTVNSDDSDLVQDQSNWALWTNSGRGYLSQLRNRKGYAGYEWDPAVSIDHVRHRAYTPEMGKCPDRFDPGNPNYPGSPIRPGAE